MSKARSVRLAATIVALAVLCVEFAPLPATAGERLAPHAAGEVLVRFKRRVDGDDVVKSLAKSKSRVLAHLGNAVDRKAGEPGVYRVATDLSVEDAIDVLRRDKNVEFAEPNYLVTRSDVSDDSYYVDGGLWGMYGDDAVAVGPDGTTNAYGCNAESAWNKGVTGSRSVFVGVVDEGLQFDHPDLAANVWTNPYDPVDGIDNDGNGMVDDVHGWDFFNGDNGVYDGTGDDHGTHVAGTIGGAGGNGAGVAGVNWNVTMISAKFMGPSGGYVSDAAAALDYLRDLKVRHGLNVVCSSNSWGGGGYSATLHTAILKAAKAGMLFVASAGNSGTDNDGTPIYPASYSTLEASPVESAATYEAVIAVAALDPSGALAGFSSYGAASVDIAAPGVSVLSTVPTDSYAYYSGTSMAAPHVAGAVALYASAYPTATAYQIRTAILANATPTSSLAGLTVTGGRLNLGGTLFDVPPPPDSSSPPPPPASPVGTHDVAVTAVVVPPNLRRSSTVNVKVTVANQGTHAETFAVSLAATAGSVAAPITVTLAPGVVKTVMFGWRIPSVLGAVGLTATSAVVSGETDAADNVRSTTASVAR